MKNTYKEPDRNLLLEIGNRIRILRENRNLSQERLSFASQLDRTYIGSVERGERNISIINLNKIANALHISLSDLLSTSYE
jgi:transcriptional regulator with XRE-family HTH domain